MYMIAFIDWESASVVQAPENAAAEPRYGPPTGPQSRQASGLELD